MNHGDSEAPVDPAAGHRILSNRPALAQARDRWPLLVAVERALATHPRVVFAAAPTGKKRPTNAASLWEE